MKNFLVLLLTVMFLGLTTFTVADTRCPLTGNAYTLEVDGISYELSGFDCTFGPGCLAKCELWYGNFDIGPTYLIRLPFNCQQNGDITIANIPCSLNSEGNLECLAVNTADYHCVHLGNKTWCFPEKPEKLQFDLEE